MSPLIDGLPDEVAIQCLARVPFYFHPQLQLVCHSWRAVLRSPDIFKTRCEVGALEELLCVLAFEPENIWQLYDPLQDRWITLPIMPSEIRHLARFGVAPVGGKLFVIGGGSDRVDPLTGDHDRIFASNEVWSYDPFRCEWEQRAPMLVRRAMFACCALDGKIVVAGGFTNCRESIANAEIYDPQLDTWEPLPDLQHSHSSACSGVVIGERCMFCTRDYRQCRYWRMGQTVGCERLWLAPGSNGCGPWRAICSEQWLHLQTMWAELTQ
ncbi:Kelch motif [Musa troglodytarum]|uniref:Kelch motif n=1 Tax=Musa troglodytarum TaxID=320322 RepID=A0A9E7G7K1_9LILI|nr:Kelch motif [Musa troglodytarum]URE09929.1 Kelch motif [Musa troglodytarum]